MAFFISKQGNPQILLTDGGSLLLGDGLKISNGTISVIGGEGSSSPSFDNVTIENNLKIGDTIFSELTPEHLLFNDEDLELEITKNSIELRDGDNEYSITWRDLIKLLNGENDNYLRQEVEGLTISSALNDLNSRIEVLERKLA